jgi:uncharacterized repeat protein (TIGR03833 family)
VSTPLRNPTVLIIAYETSSHLKSNLINLPPPTFNLTFYQTARSLEEYVLELDAFANKEAVQPPQKSTSMNSSQHTNRSGRGPSNRGRGRGGRSRGGFNDRSDSVSGMKPVPTIREVVPDAPVSIILKVDQPTGNEVQGIVAELLTRGDHPRGIKVRLQDGRVGRVQRIVSEETARLGSEGLSELGRNGEFGMESNLGIQVKSTPATAPVGGFTGRRYGDYRIDEPDEPASTGLSLSDYVVTKTKRKGRQKNQIVPDSDEDDQKLVEGGTARVASDSTIDTAKCPVCGEFEGDEVAVAHHVNTHFD